MFVPLMMWKRLTSRKVLFGISVFTAFPVTSLFFVTHLKDVELGLAVILFLFFLWIMISTGIFAMLLLLVSIVREFISELKHGRNE